MNVSDLIKISIRDIASSVYELDQEFKQKYTNIKVNPTQVGNLIANNYHKVEFDIAISIVEETGINSSSIKVATIEQSGSSSQTAISRIKFVIPTSLPTRD